jgi:hypothetical protein
MSGVPRVESVIFPLLEGGKRFLAAPQPSSSPELGQLRRQIRWLVAQSRGGPMAMLRQLKPYLKYLPLTPDDLTRQIKVGLY